MARYLAIWALFTMLLSAAVYLWSDLPLAAAPDPDSARWVNAAWAAARSGARIPEAPAAAKRYHAAGPTFVSLYAGGRLRERHVASGNLADVVLTGIAKFTNDPSLRALPGFQLPSPQSER
ncbi:MAG TPA: hypothetical protein VFN67_10555, partial [Polyangiales bacterium]|nr:hypothetical protein [Polyangiales bacterium]